MSLSDCGHGFNSFHDYFGLSNLVNNIKISEDNPLLQSTQKNLALLKRTRRQSWGSDGSDNAAVLSPTMESQHQYDRFDLNNNFPDKPPSTRLSRAMRDHIVSGAYHQHMENRNSEKCLKQPLIMPPSPQNSTQSSPPPILGMPPPQASGSRGTTNGVQVCVFCRNNGESESVYTSHVLKDTDGRTSCPILRAYTCPICKANGDNSHTIKYCPMNQNARMSNSMGQGNQQQHMGFVPRNFRPPFPPLPPNMPMGQARPPFQRMNNKK